MLTEELLPAVRDCLAAIRHEFSDLGDELATPGRSFISAEQVTIWTP